MDIHIPEFLLISGLGVLASLGGLLLGAIAVFIGFMGRRGTFSAMAAGAYFFSPFISWRGPAILVAILLVAGLTGSFGATALIAALVSAGLAATILPSL